MPATASPYYNPQYAEAASSIAKIITGDPQRAGQLAYAAARTNLAKSEAERSNLENGAINGGIESALTAAGQDPKTISANMPHILAQMIAGKVSDPAKVLGPQWAITGESQSGASPAQALVRAAYAGRGDAIPVNLALTPGEATGIRQQQYDAEDKRAVDAANARVSSPGKSKPLKTDDVNAAITSILSAIPGVIDPGTNGHRATVVPEAQNFLEDSGALEPMRNLVVQTLRDTNGDQEAARAAVMKSINIPAGTHFSAGSPGGYFGLKKAVPAGLVGNDGTNINMNAIVNAIASSMQNSQPVTPASQAPSMPAGPGVIRQADFGGAAPSISTADFSMPQSSVPVPPPAPPAAVTGLVRVGSRAEALQLPPNVQFMTPDGNTYWSRGSAGNAP